MTHVLGYDPLEPLRSAAAKRAAAGLRASVAPRTAGGDELVDLASDDYLGLARDGRITVAAATAAQTWGAGATGPRVATGSTDLHTRLEEELAAFLNQRAALTFSSGYLADLGVIATLAGPDALVAIDESVPPALLDAARLSGARLAIFADLDGAATALAGREEPAALLVTASVYPLDGAEAPLRQLHRLAHQHGALLVVDESHALGVVGDGGSGAVATAGLAGFPEVVVTASLGKALGSQGGLVAGAPEVIETLVDACPVFASDTALAPASAGAALAALGVLRDEPWLAARARAHAARIAAAAAERGLAVTTPFAAVVGLPLGTTRDALRATEACAAYGVRAGCVRPPAVPSARSGLRLSARADLTDPDLKAVGRALSAVRTTVGG
ncbi:MAG: aminotransferase class I/II-fold pyridoxal phosphate-dependent enzyme [Mycobacteriales bacterium]